MILMEKAKSKQFWEDVRTQQKYQKIVNMIKKRYQDTKMEQIEVLKYSSRMRHDRDGDRKEFEAVYFRRKNYMGSVALMALIYPEEPVYLDQLQEIIWAVCEEYCWVLPAHIKFAEYGDNSYIDLFAAETAFSLAEIRYMLEDRLDAKIQERIQESLEWRILRNVERGQMNWEVTDNNWAAVVGGAVGGTLMYAFPEKFDNLLPRFLDTMKSFLSGYSEEGICFEGLEYWIFGFGAFTWFADLLHQYTDGKIDLFADEKVERCAAFGQRNFIKGNTKVSFADTSLHGEVCDAMQNYLAQRYPRTVLPLPESLTTPVWAGNVVWMRLLRALYYLSEDVVPPQVQTADYYLPQAGQVIINNPKYSLAVKAGHNDECEGHNDVGNFILSTDQGQIFADIGGGRYCKAYFDKATRYDIFCVGSHGHSVPMINGKRQKHGREYAGNITYEGNHICLEISGAYDLPEVKRLNRTFVYEEDRVTLTDSFAPDYESLTERFVCLLKPKQIAADRIGIGDVVLSFDPECAKVHIVPVEHDETGGIRIVYCIDFELIPGLESVTFEMFVE